MTDSEDAASQAAATDKTETQSGQHKTSQHDRPDGHEQATEGEISREGTPPPLPPRPKALQLLGEEDKDKTGALKTPKHVRPTLLSKATTALSLGNIHSYHETSPSPSSRPVSRAQQQSFGAGHPSRSGSDAGDRASIRSYMPTSETDTYAESLLGEVVNDQKHTSWNTSAHPDRLYSEDLDLEDAFAREFEDVEGVKTDGSNEASAMAQWKAKLKHFLILTSAGKPVWSRHGDDQLITNYIGIVHTIISFYQGAKDELKGFTAGEVRFVVLPKGNLNLVAISRIGESDTQLRTQLEALYMQVLSTLTLPSMNRMFAHRSSTDLRRPLQGTESLLSALADGFTRGSPSTLLSALECLKLRKTHRQVINNTLLKTKSPNLLYGLIVAGGRLVSVVRPKKHSLHPGDLHLIFNMLFEAGGVQAGGGENWIPLCLPGFNNTGYLYMYVSFLNIDKVKEEITERPATSDDNENEVATILISANKEAFFELKGMRNELVEQLYRNGGLDNIRAAIKRGRPSCTDIIPGTVLRHFLYKSRGNVQFVMPTYSPYFETTIARRHLLNLYTSLHSTLHARPTPPKIHHSTQTHCIALAWTTPLFELYAVAPAHTSRAALTQAVNKLVLWVKREEERVFIIGGAVF